MFLNYYRFIILCLTMVLAMAVGTTQDSYAAVQDVRLVDITPRSLFSHSAVDLAFTSYDLLTLGAGNNLLNVYDMSDIINPRRRAIFELPAQGVSITAEGMFAFVACPGRGLVAIDLTNSNRPEVAEIYKYDIGPEAEVLLVGEYVYLNDGHGVFRSFQRTRPWELKEAGSLNVKGYGEMVYMAGYIHFASDGIAAVDVSIPSNLKVAMTPVELDYIQALAASDGYVCIVDNNNTLVLFKAGTDGGLAKISKFDVGHIVRDIAISKNLVAVITADDLITIDITKPEKMKLFGDLPLVCELRKVTPRGDFFFLATELDGPLVADVRDALRQKVVAYQAGLGLVSTIASRGSLMLAGSWDSIRALERREQGDVEIVGIQHSEGFTREMQITGDFAYLADPTRGLRVFNVSRPVFMRPVGLLELPGTPSDVELVGDLAFVPLGDKGVAQVNIHYPFSPILRMTIKTEHPVTNVARAGNYLYFLGPDGYMGIYDISIPTQPRQAAWLMLSGLHPIDAQVHGDMMAVSGGTDGLWLFSVAEPIRPVVRSKYIPGGSVETAALFDDGAILEVKGPGYCRLELIDLRYMFAPYKRTELALTERSDYSDKLHVVGNRAYLAAYNYGMKMIEMRGLLD